MIRRIALCTVLSVLTLIAGTSVASAVAVPPTPAPAPTAPAPSPSPPAQMPIPYLLPGVGNDGTILTPPPGGVSPTPDRCGFFDINCMVSGAIRDWFTSLVKDTLNPAFAAAGQFLLSSPVPSETARLKELIEHIRLIANSLLILFVLAGGVIVMTHGSVQTSTTVKEVTPRLVLAAVAVNFSAFISDQAVRFANGLVAAIVGEGADPKRAGQFLTEQIQVENLAKSATGFVLMLVVAIVMALLLALIGMIRVTIVSILVIAAPLALICHALPQSEAIARFWWRSLTGVLAIQVLQALAWMLLVKVQFSKPTHAPGVTESFWDVMIIIGLLLVLIKIPGWVARTVWRGAQPHMITRILQTVLISKGLSKALGGSRMSATRTPPPARGTTPPSIASPSGPPGPRPAGPGNGKRGPNPKQPPPAPAGHRPAPTPPPAGSIGNAGSKSVRHEQLALPITIEPPPARPRQLALPIEAKRITPPLLPPRARPRPERWIHPRPPYVQDKLPGMPKRPARPQQMWLRLDPPRRGRPRGERR